MKGENGSMTQNKFQFFEFYNNKTKEELIEIAVLSEKLLETSKKKDRIILEFVKLIRKVLLPIKFLSCKYKNEGDDSWHGCDYTEWVDEACDLVERAGYKGSKEWEL